MVVLSFAIQSIPAAFGVVASVITVAIGVVEGTVLFVLGVAFAHISFASCFTRRTVEAIKETFAFVTLGIALSVTEHFETVLRVWTVLPGSFVHVVFDFTVIAGIVVWTHALVHVCAIADAGAAIFAWIL